jgi:hypothetical protein
MVSIEYEGSGSGESVNVMDVMSLSTQLCSGFFVLFVLFTATALPTPSSSPTLRLAFLLLIGCVLLLMALMMMSTGSSSGWPP